VNRIQQQCHTTVLPVNIEEEVAATAEEVVAATVEAAMPEEEGKASDRGIMLAVLGGANLVQCTSFRKR
jgi:hypothetical protein